MQLERNRFRLIDCRSKFLTEQIFSENRFPLFWIML